MSLSRRHFLAGLATAPLAMSTKLKANPNPVRVLIIGAGIAGLAAARALTDQGIKVTILEGRERIGGRIHTSPIWPNLPMDLGASWIHGQKQNPITQLANAAQAKRVATDYDSSKLYIDTRLKQLGVQSANEAAIERLVTTALNQAAHLDHDISVQAAVNRLLTEPLTPAYQAQLNFYLNSQYEQEYSGAAHALSAQTVEDNEEFSGADVLFPQGYQQIPNYLAQDLDIQLGKVVAKITYTETAVTVTTQDQSYQADYAIITVPLGVLKRKAIQFQPSLPAAKQVAIQRLGMGLLNKAYLKFDKVFWPKEIDWLEYLSPEAGRWVEWVSFAKIGAPVLLGFHAADRARELESWSDQALIAEAMQALKAMFGNAIPQPVGAQITRWAQDPFAYGSYSFNAVGSTNRDRQILARKLGGLYWAGEATHSEYPGTVHGAYLSGIRAAKQLLKVL
ncbi:flavin monoamine oxidase family protein [Thiothrix eikelboomii]|uniref:flavin monoamine oxidase family protein n=1 Tax=Thiothrix eikelboomii TaxID=92487 RepID=UPI003BAF6206